METWVSVFRISRPVPIWLRAYYLDEDIQIVRVEMYGEPRNCVWSECGTDEFEPRPPFPCSLSFRSASSYAQQSGGKDKRR